MTKVSPMLAEALGLPKTNTETKTPSAKPAAAKKPATTVKPKAPAKPAAKPAKKPAKKAAASDKKAKQPKVKMERDSFTMPKEEYAQITVLKARLQTLGQPAKKSELLRAGVMLLAVMSDNTLKATLAKVPAIKTGRPKKNK